MMRRIWLLLLALLAPTLLMGIMIRSNNSKLPSEQGQHVLNMYLTTQGLSQAPAAMRLFRSRNGRAFTQSMSQSSYGEGWSYQTTHTFSKPAPDQTIIFPDTRNNAAVGQANNLKMLLYPPVEVWCVEMRDKSDGKPTYRILAQHQDLYSAEWIVHELPTDEDSAAQILAKIGCQ